MTAIALRDLPFLNAFLLESMRVHGITVSLNERIAPEGGAMVSGQTVPAEVFQHPLSILSEGNSDM